MFRQNYISIHALLAESDYTHPIGVLITVIISIHALLAESDAPWLARLASYVNFYPRSPCGERPYPSQWRTLARDFYPRSPCGERRSGYFRFSRLDVISIHALLAESDCQWRRSVKLFRQFLSTLSLRRATSHIRTSTPRITFLSTLSLRRATA